MVSRLGELVVRLLLFAAVGATLMSMLPGVSAGWGFGGGPDPGKVRLQDVQVLTLKQGKMTTGRRSSPVQQLNCVGGSARGVFNPQSVQCYNRGFDGVDVQWECKADMDNLYRFGEVEVVCEGYDYPEDPYITKGSCGLEYTIEYTKEGQDRQKRESSWGGGSSNYYDTSSYYNKKNSMSSGLAGLILFSVVCVVCYALYKTCCTGEGQTMGDRQYSSTDGDYPGGTPGGGGWFGGANNQHHNNGPGGGGFDNGQCGGAGGRYNRNAGTGAGNFWTGLGVGGLMGYMFGNRGGGYGGYNRGYGGYGGFGAARPRYGGGLGGGSLFGGGGGGGGFSMGGGGGGGSSGTRSASGYGGTRRR